MMKDDNEDDLKNKEDMHIGGHIPLAQRWTYSALRYFILFLISSFLCNFFLLIKV